MVPQFSIGMSLRNIVLICCSVVIIYSMVGTVGMFLILPSLIIRSFAILGATVTGIIVSSLLHYHEREQKKQTTSLEPNSNT